jgi:hypothetical protein
VAAIAPVIRLLLLVVVIVILIIKTGYCVRERIVLVCHGAQLLEGLFYGASIQ